MKTLSSLSSQARIISYQYELLRTAPPGTTIEFCQDTESNWYPNARLVEWNEQYIVIQEHGQEIRLGRQDINEFRHSFVPKAPAELAHVQVLQAA